MRLSSPVYAFAFASALVVACGGASNTDFDSDDGSAGEPAGGSGQGGTDQGGSGGSSSGSGGSSQGGSNSTGGAPTGGSPTGGVSTGGSPTGGASTGGSPTGGVSGTGMGGASGTGNAGTTGGANPTGGTGGGGGAGQGGAGGASGRAGSGGSGGVSGRAGSGGQGGTDCTTAIQRAQIALASAQICNPLIGGMPCAGTVKDLCDCSVPVASQTSQATMTYLEAREAAMKCGGIPCLAIVCAEPTTAVCGLPTAVSGIVVATSCHWSPR